MEKRFQFRHFMWTLIKHWDSIIGYILMMIVSIAPQLLQNSIFIQTPIFKELLHEELSISAWIVFSFMISNIFTISYFLISIKIKFINEITIAVALGASVYVSVCTSIWWDTSHHGRSYAIMLFSFLAASLGNIALTVLFTFASKFQQIYISAISIGFGLSGVIPLIIALTQNAENPSNIYFSPTVFFAITSTLIFLFSLGFIVIGFTPLANRLKAPEPSGVITMNTSAIRSENNYSKLIDTSLSSDSLIDSDEDDDDENLLQSNNSLFSPINQSGGRSSLQNFGADFSYSVLPEQVLPYSATQKVRMFLPVILFSFWINLMTYYIPGVIPFQVSDDERYFWWNVEFILFPAIGACFVASEKLRVYRVDFLVIIMTILFVVLEVPAIKFTPNPAIPNFFWFNTIVLGIYSFLMGFTTTMIFLKIRRDVTERQVFSVEAVSKFAGIVGQIGGITGSSITLTLVLFDCFYSSQI